MSVPALVLALAAASAHAAPKDGAALFDANGCRSCHAVAGVGGNPGPDLTLVGFRRPRAWLDAWLASPHAVKPDTLMPEQRLSPASREALVDFLSSLTAVPPQAPLPTDGRALYAKAGCVACHNAQGRGGHPNPNAKDKVIPALRDLSDKYSDDELRAKIKNGSRPDSAADAFGEPIAMPKWGTVLSDEQIAAVAAYVKSFGTAAGKKGDW